MAQWGQGFQYPMQTGYNPQQFQQGFPPGGIAPQPTGFPGQRPVGFQQPQPTGFPGTQGFQQPQMTGFPAQQSAFQPQQTGFQPGSTFQQRAPPPPPVPPVPSIPSQFQQQNAQRSGFVGLPQQQTNSFMGPSPGLTAPHTAQPTGFAGGGMRPLVPQMTGFVDPRLQMMSNSFLPANPSMPYTSGGAPQLQQQGGLSLQQSFQQHNQAQRGSTAPKIPWALSRAEKKSYDQIFRAWDSQNTGFISGQTALEVFGQSGLDKNDLAKIWALADADNRGKLNLAEFHVAMGLIYRRLNGNEIPDQLPEELVPPSHRDLDTSVNLLKDILKNDTRARSPSGFDAPVSRLRDRSLHSTSVPGAGGRQDATVYKYNDESPPGGFYQPRSRHVDRSAVRTAAESESPSAELDDMKRQLENTAKMLDRTAAESASRTAEDEALDREMSDLKYKVKRVQEDLDYVSRGPRTTAKDEERRRLERDLLKLMHERLPEVERKIKDREERKEREKREWARDRDRRNDRFGRYDDRDDRYSSYDRDRDREDDRDRGYLRGTYDRDDRDHDRDHDYGRDRDRERDRDRDYDKDRSRDFDRDRPYSRNRDRDYDRPRSPPAARSPPPPPPPASSGSVSKPPPAAPKLAPSPAPNMKNMSPEERQAFIRAEGQRRLQERMAALGVVTSSTPSSKLDTSVEDRLAQEKKEAEEKAKAAERESEERERIRRERLEGEKALKEGKSPAPPTPSTPTAAAPPPTVQAPPPKPTPPPAKSRAPAPPPPRKSSAPKLPVRAPSAPIPPAPTPPAQAPPASAPSTPAPAPAVPEIDEDDEIRARQEALRKQRERLARLRQLEEEEEEAKHAEEEYQARRRAAKAAAQTPPAAPEPPAVAPAPLIQVRAPPLQPPPTPSAPAAATAPPPPPPPPPPPAAAPAAVETPSEKYANNPFSRLMKESPGAAVSPPSAPAANGSTNPFFHSQVPSSSARQAVPAAPAAPPAPAPPAAAPPAPSIPPPSRSPAPAAIRTTYHTAPGESEDEWDEIQEKEVDDSSEDDLDSSRDTRNKLAQQLFGSILPPSRPQSAAAPTRPSEASQPSSSAPPPPPPPPSSAPPMTTDIFMAPPPPMAPAAPPPPPAPAAAPPALAGDRGALLGAIQAGAKLRKAQTNDRSASALAGHVLGDTAPPAHINAAARASSLPRPAAEPAIPPDLELPQLTNTKSSNRESVNWYAGLAADGGATQHEMSRLPSMQEEEELAATVPHIQVDAAEETDPMTDVDKSVEYRVRSLYRYEGQRQEDLSFAENLVLTAHPSKSGGDWWYGTLVQDGKSGFFPKTYIDKIEATKAKALYAYAGNSPDEMSFAEDDELNIVDRSDPDWWKAEQGGIVLIVPAGYLEILEVSNAYRTILSNPTTYEAPSVPPEAKLTITAPIPAHDDADGVEEDEESESESESESETDYESSSESESDDDDEQLTEEARKVERETRELERRRVLEAAGFIIKSDVKPPPRPVRTRSRRGRRPPPAVPERLTPKTPHKDLPRPPDHEDTDSSLRLDDAFERYEAFKLSHASSNRLSMASIETSPSTSVSLPSPSTPVPRSGSAEPESRGIHFLSFFGRKTPGNDGELRTMPTISAPILIKDPSMPIDEDEVAFGSSWASLVDKSALAEIPTKERRRQEAIFELMTTEATYVRDLQLIVEVFYANVLPLLDEKAVTVIFANIEDILLTNTTFLSSLEERQKECRLYIDSIGDILKTNMAEMGVYMDYCVNQATAIKVLQTLRESNLELAARLQSLRDDPAVRNLDLSSYLLAPMQRITRYPLLLKQIIRYTEASGDRKQIERALSMAESVLEQINETIREQEGRERLKAISKDLWIGQGRLDLTAPTRHMGARKLLREGQLCKAKSGRKLRAFLCTDILVLTEETAKSLYRMPIPLSEVQVKEVPGARDDLSFQVAIAYPRGGDRIALRTMSARDCQLWMQAIDNASRKCREAERMARS